MNTEHDTHQGHPTEHDTPSNDGLVQPDSQKQTPIVTPFKVHNKNAIVPLSLGQKSKSGGSPFNPFQRVLTTENEPVGLASLKAKEYKENPFAVSRLWRKAQVTVRNMILAKRWLRVTPESKTTSTCVHSWAEPTLWSSLRSGASTTMATSLKRCRSFDPSVSCSSSSSCLSSSRF